MGVIDYPQQGDLGINLLPQRYDIEIYQGDTFDIIVTFKDSGGVGIDLTGFTALVEFNDETTNAVVVTPTVTVNAGGVHGAVEIYILDTSVIAAGEYQYDLQLTDPGGRRRTYIGGRVTVTADVSE